MAVAARYNARVAHVEAVGTLFNGAQEVKSGSGLLIGDSYVVTNNHVIPREQNYEQLAVSVRLKSRLLDPRAVQAVHRDPERDLALLELKAPVPDAGGPRCPMPVVKAAEQVPMGSSIVILGFPLNQDLSISGGLVSNHNDGKGRWQTDTLVNPGNSGGPAFDWSGALVGVAVGGITKWKFGTEEQDVDGVNFIIPSSSLLESPLLAKITDLPPDRRCWTELQAGVTASAAVAAYPRLQRISRVHFVSETKDDHPDLQPRSQNYQKTFQAEPGYRITGCSWSGASENHHSDVVCNVQPGGGSVLFTFRLTSGPLFSRWRGWLAGTVTLEQELAP